MPQDKLATCLRETLAEFGDKWDAEQVVGEVVPMCRRHIPADVPVKLVISLLHEGHLVVRVDDAQGHTLQTWEYVPALP